MSDAGVAVAMRDRTRSENADAPTLSGPVAGGSRWPLRIGLAIAAAGLFTAYLSMSRAMSVNADAASNAMQAWEMLHGNVLLRGWTVTDVSFYTNELLLYALVELVRGYHADVVHITAALTYLLLVLVVAAAAGGRATGRETVLRVGLAVAIVAVPAHGLGTSVLLLAPDHTGSSIPLLLTWLVLERAMNRADGSPAARRPRWLPYAVAAMLAWGQIADPLIMYIGALPLILVGLLRFVRDRNSRGFAITLVAAGFASVLLAQGVLAVIRLAGGFGAHPPTAGFSPLARLPENAWTATQALAANYGAFFPDRHGAAGVALGVVHLAFLVLAVAALALVTARALRRAPGWRDGWLLELVAAGMLVNVGAFVVSTLPGDLGTSRQIVAVLPLGAVLAARVWAPRLAAPRLAPPRLVPPRLVSPRLASPRLAVLRRSVPPALAAILLVLTGELAAQSTAPPRPAEGQDVAEWLDSQGLAYGIGGYWNANNITLVTSGRVRVAPVVGGTRIRGYRWESRAEWYDPARHDARFIVIDRWHPSHGTEGQAVAQFGEPISRHPFERATVLVYDHNLLVGLPAACGGSTAPSMAECPAHGSPLWTFRR